MRQNTRPQGPAAHLIDANLYWNSQKRIYISHAHALHGWHSARCPLSNSITHVEFLFGQIQWLKTQQMTMIASCKAQKQHRVPRWCSALTSRYDTLYFALSRPRCEEVWYTCCLQKRFIVHDFVAVWRGFCDFVTPITHPLWRYLRNGSDDATTHKKQRKRGKTWKFNPKTTLFWMIFPSLLL